MLFFQQDNQWGGSSPFEGAGDRPVHFVHKDAIEKERKRDIIIIQKICAEEADSVKSTGSRGDDESAARELFRILREFDDEGVERIYSESFDEGPLGQAIMNRLMKAAGHKVISLTK